MRRHARFVNNFPGLGPDLLRPVPQAERPPAWLPGRRHLLVPCARNGLHLGWKALGLESGTHVLLPAFVCNTVSRPLEQAGALPVYFNVFEDLSIDWDHVTRLVRSKPYPRAMLWYHYLGLPIGFDDVVQFCREHGLYLIEDCAHALFSEHRGVPVGSTGDISVFSFRKTIPVLHAGALVVNNRRLGFRPPPLWREQEPGYQEHLCRLEIYLNRLHFQSRERTRQVLRPHFREALAGTEEWYGNAGRIRPIDPVSRLVMHNVEPDPIRRARRRNFRVYLRELGALGLVRELPSGACPLGFPIRVKRRATLRRQMEGMGVEAVTHWWRPLLPEGVARRFATASRLAATVLTMPCHQDLSVPDIEYACATLKRLL